MAAGIKVVGYDSSPAAGAYNVFVNQTDFGLIGQSMADWACDLAPSCTGEIAVLSATATASNQNAWIASMKTVLAGAKYAGLKLDDVVFGNDDRLHRHTGVGARGARDRDAYPSSSRPASGPKRAA